MTDTIIEIKSEGYGFSIPRTTVYVDGKFIYQSGNAVAIEQEHIEKLITSLWLNKDVKIKSIYTKDNK